MIYLARDLDPFALRLGAETQLLAREVDKADAGAILSAGASNLLSLKETETFKTLLPAVELKQVETAALQPGDKVVCYSQADTGAKFVLFKVLAK